jgi:hypothetical protein
VRNDSVGAPRLAFLIADASEAERQARLRELRALALVYFGGKHPITAALRAAIVDPDATNHALNLLDASPALTRRRLLAAYGALLSRGAAP